MKVSHLLAASIAVLSLGHMASASVTIRVTGSSAFRAATTNAIKNILSSGTPTFAFTTDGTATNFSNGSYQTFVGTYPGVSGTVTVKTAWTGSVAGIRDVSQGLSIPFLTDAQAASGTTTGVNLGATVPTVAEGVPDIVMEDNRQSSTTFTSPSINFTSVVGIIPFAICANAQLPTLTNITAQHAKALLSNGTQPLSLITGLPADTKKIVQVGRDPFSGTRVVYLAEIGYGTQVNVAQYQGTSVDGSNNLGKLDIYPALTDPPVPDIGNGGESSGGKVANLLRYSTASTSLNGTTATALGVIGYLGENDSYNAVWGVGAGVTGGNAANAHYVSYNGVSAFGGKSFKPTSLTTTGTGTSKVLSGITPALTATTDLVVGQIVTGTNIAPGSVIVSVDSVTQVTVDKFTLAPGTTTNAQIGSLLPAVIRNGAYTFWNYEYIGWKTSVVGSDNTSQKWIFADALRADIHDTDYGFSGLGLDSAFKVQRADDGEPVTP